MGTPSGTNWFVLNLAESLPNYVMYLSKLLLNWVGHEYTCTPMLSLSRRWLLSSLFPPGNTYWFSTYDQKWQNIDSTEERMINYKFRQISTNQSGKLCWTKPGILSNKMTLHVALNLTTMQNNNLPNFFYISFSFITHQFLKTFLSAFSGLITRLSVIAKRAPKYLS